MKRRRKKNYGCLIAAAIFTIVAVIFVYRYFNGVVAPELPGVDGIAINKKKYPITGIDISNHTGRVNFAKIPKEEIDFIYMKASEGVSLKDKRFERNYMKTLNDSEIPFGFYHFFRFNKDGAEQAEFFLENIRGKKYHLPLVIDVEEWGNPVGVKRAKVVENIGKFIEHVERNKSGRIMIYTNESSYDRYIKGNFDDYDLWICSFRTTPNVNREWTIWQHSHKGKYEWADGWVDINTFNGSQRKWRKYMNN